VKKPVIPIMFLSLYTGILSGQTEQMVIPGDLKQQTIITEPITLRKGYFRAGIEGSFSIIDRVFDEDANRSYLLESNAWGKFSEYLLALSYGISDRLQVVCNVPYVRQQTFISTLFTNVRDRNDTIISERTRGNGLGDVEAGIEYQLFMETDRLPAVMIGTRVTVPIGPKNPRNIVSDLQYDRPTGGGNFEWETYVVVKKIIYPFSSTTRLQYEHNFPGRKILSPGDPEIAFKPGDQFILASDFGIQLNDWISLSNEIGLTVSGENTYHSDPVAISPSSWLIYCYPTLSFQLRRFRFVQSIFVPVAGKYGPADPVYVFALYRTF
jgi:hypothetical protein